MPRLKRTGWHRLRKPAVGLLVVAAHGAVLVAVAVHVTIRQLPDMPRHRKAMQWIEIMAERTPITPVAPSPTVAGNNASAVPDTRRPRATTAAPLQIPAAAVAGAHAIEVNTAVDIATNAPAPLKLDPETMRKAVQQVKSSDKAIDLMPPNKASGEQPRSAAALSKGIAAAQHGDCLHGEFAGSGMELLSIPFLAAAYLRGHCAR